MVFKFKDSEVLNVFVKIAMSVLKNICYDSNVLLLVSVIEVKKKKVVKYVDFH